MKREELLRSREFWIEEIQLNLFNEIKNYIDSKKITKSQFADELGVTKGYVTQILNGEFNHKISKLIDLSLAINKAPVLSFLDLDQFIRDDVNGQTHMLNKHLRPIQFITNTFSGNYSKVDEKDFAKINSIIVKDTSKFQIQEGGEDSPVEMEGLFT